MAIHKDIEELVQATWLADTHEHIIEESIRLGPVPGHHLYSCNDWAYLLSHYTSNDLIACGMPEVDLTRFFSADVDLDEKWRLVEPYWERVKYAGYGLAVRITLKVLYGEDDITAENHHRLNEKYLARVHRGFYREIIRDIARIRFCQVNSLQHTFCESDDPDLLQQDLSIMPLSTPPVIKDMAAETGIEAATLRQWYDVIDAVFAKYGAKAVAVKSQAAYGRPLDYEDVPLRDAAPLFERHARGEELPWPEMKALQDHLFRRCVRKAVEYRLPVKLHTGYYAGNSYMQLDRVSHNPAHLCVLLQDFPEATFDIFHIGYPYQEEMIALAKHYPNACVDMCWAWIINPEACVRFLRDYLVCAPWNKIHTFGGDYFSVENVVGHAAMARKGIAQALSDLVENGWMSSAEALRLVPEIMHRNAERNFLIAEKGMLASLDGQTGAP